MAALTEEQRELILELVEDEELTKAEIARRAGVSRPSVYKALREAGIWEPGSSAGDAEETYARNGEGADAGEYEGEETEGEDEDDAYADEADDEDEYEDEEEDEDEALEEAPAPVVLGSPASALVGLVGGAVLGAVGLYYAMMRGIIPPPGGRQA